MWHLVGQDPKSRVEVDSIAIVPLCLRILRKPLNIYILLIQPYDLSPSGLCAVVNAASHQRRLAGCSGVGACGPETACQWAEGLLGHRLRLASQRLIGTIAMYRPLQTPSHSCRVRNMSCGFDSCSFILKTCPFIDLGCHRSALRCRRRLLSDQTPPPTAQDTDAG